MGIECKYSFSDLFKAAYKRSQTKNEVQVFNKLSQKQRNEQVKKWAKIANWNTLSKQGTDGKTYLAFAPVKIIQKPARKQQIT